MVLAGAPVGGVRTIDTAIVGGEALASFQINLSDARPPGLLAYIPINASAKILDARLEFGASPVFNSTLIRGWGTAERSQEEFGQPVEGRADFNDDGFADIAVGAPMRIIPNEPGRIEVYYGGPTGIASLPNWSYIGTSGIQFGGDLSHADINGDGIDDLLVAEQNQNYQGTPPERGYVFYGSTGGLPSTPDVVVTSGTPGVNTGWANSISGGDLNGDGFDELVVPELIWNASPYETRVWVYWGGPAGLNLSNVTFFNAPGPDFFEFGYPMIELGDTDADGLFELASGKQTYHDGWGGIVVMEGTRNSTAINFTWDYNGSFGRQVRDGFAGGGDLTGDGLPDFVGGHAIVNSGGGAIGIFPGLANGSYSNLPSVIMNFTNNGESFSSGACVGDFDGDGRLDLIVGANHDSSDAEGEAYLFSDREYGQAYGGVFRGGPFGMAEGFGTEANTLGDVNGDGLTDFAVTSSFGYNGTYQPGTVRVFYGNRHPFPENVTIEVAGNSVWSKAGRLKGPTTEANLTLAFQTYMDSQRGQATATGLTDVPLRFQFEQGGRLVASKVTVRYSVVLPPEGGMAASDPSGDAIVVSWAVRSPASDGALVIVWSNKSGIWDRLAVVGATRGVFVDTEVTAGVLYHYNLSEWDTAGAVVSASTATFSATPVDTRPPRVPSVLPLELDVANRAVTVRWLPNGDDTVRYEVWRQVGDTQAPSRVANLSSSQSAFRDQGLPEETNLSYSVLAVDEAGLASPQSEPLTARLPDLVSPLVPGGLRAQAGASGTRVFLNWSLNAADTVGYLVWVSAPNAPSGFSLAGSTAGSTFEVVGLARGATYTFRVQAVDQAGHTSPNATATAQTADLEAPRAPLITRVEAPASGKTVVIEWASSDEDVTDFIVTWNPAGPTAGYVEIDSTRRSFNITGLVDDVAVQVQVRARDLVGQEGPNSVAVTAVPHDGVAPGAPTSVRASPLPEGGALRVEWQAPADPDVAGYKVYFRIGPSGPFALAGATGGTSLAFTHRGLANGVSYTYVVSAIDGAVNEGANSAATSATAQDTLPPAVPLLDRLPARTAQAQLELTGSAEPSTTVEVQLNGALAGSATASAGGAFGYSVTLEEGDNVLRVRAVDSRAGVGGAATFGDYSAEFHVVLDGDAPAFNRIEPAPGAAGFATSAVFAVYADESLDPFSLQVSLRSADGEEVAVDISYIESSHSIHVTPLFPLRASAQYELTVSGADAAGNALAPQKYAFTTAGSDSPAAIYGASAAALVGAALGALMLRRRRRAPSKEAKD